MVQSNEFKGRNLAAAVRMATAAYRLGRPIERKDICRNLLQDLEAFKREASDTLDDLEDLNRDVERLRNEARRAALEGVVSAAVAASGGLGTAIRALRTLKRLRKPELSRRDWLSFVPLVGGGIVSALSALESIEKSQEADRLARQAERLQRKADGLGDDILRIADEFRRSGCDASDRIS